MIVALGLVAFYSVFTWVLVSYLLTFTRYDWELPPPAPAVLYDREEVTLSSDFVGLV